MPSQSARQRGFFGLVKSIQKGKTPEEINPSVLKRARKAAGSMSEKQVNEFQTINPAKALRRK